MYNTVIQQVDPSPGAHRKCAPQSLSPVPAPPPLSGTREHCVISFPQYPSQKHLREYGYFLFFRIFLALFRVMYLKINIFRSSYFNFLCKYFNCINTSWITSLVFKKCPFLQTCLWRNHENFP